jgi:heme o synthase
MFNLIRFYIELIKVPQTGLLLFTAYAGYRSAGKCIDPLSLFFAGAGMLLVISGTTALNMVFDKDIDIIMKRTKLRPLPTKNISARAAGIFGIILIILGMALNVYVSVIYSLLVIAGTFFDLIIYTIWLKRRSPWSIIFGGLAGGMPILAGRGLVTGEVDLIGILLAFIIIAWIPTHILTLAMKYSDDYKLAGVPTFPNVFGFRNARFFITLSNVIAAVSILYAFYLLNISTPGLVIAIVGSVLLMILSLRIILNPVEKSYFTLFKYASLFMAGIMLILVLKVT